MLELGSKDLGEAGQADGVVANLIHEVAILVEEKGFCENHRHVDALGCGRTTAKLRKQRKHY